MFFHIRTEYREVIRISQYSVQTRENTDQKYSKYRYFPRSAWVKDYHFAHFFCFGCILGRQRTGKASLYKAQKLENKEEAPLSSIPNTPIVKPIRDNGTVSYAAENRGANLEEDDSETNVTTITINVEEKDKKVETELKEDNLF